MMLAQYFENMCDHYREVTTEFERQIKTGSRTHGQTVKDTMTCIGQRVSLPVYCQ